MEKHVFVDEKSSEGGVEMEVDSKVRTRSEEPHRNVGDPGDTGDENFAEDEDNSSNENDITYPSNVDDMDEGGVRDDANLSNGSKKKHRRGKHKGGSRHNKKWKPYNKLSWQERKELEDRETERACLKREERFASGHPVAPYNTTQFLMEDHNRNENISPYLKNSMDDIPENTAGQEAPGSVDSKDDYYDSPNDEESFIAKDFTETYDNIHAERLQTMTKAELVKDYIELESKVERLEAKIRDFEHPVKNASDKDNSKKLVDSTNTPSDAHLRTLLQQELERVKLENDQLRRENQQLRGGMLS